MLRRIRWWRRVGSPRPSRTNNEEHREKRCHVRSPQLPLCSRFLQIGQCRQRSGHVARSLQYPERMRCHLHDFIPPFEDEQCFREINPGKCDIGRSGVIVYKARP